MSVSCVQVRRAKITVSGQLSNCAEQYITDTLADRQRVYFINYEAPGLLDIALYLCPAPRVQSASVSGAFHNNLWVTQKLQVQVHSSV